MCDDCHSAAITRFQGCVRDLIAEGYEPHAVLTAAFRSGVYAMVGGMGETGPWPEYNDPEEALAFINREADGLKDGFVQIFAQLEMAKAQNVDYGGEA